MSLQSSLTPARPRQTTLTWPRLSVACLGDVPLESVERQRIGMLIAHASKVGDARLVQKILDRVSAEQGLLVLRRELVPKFLEHDCALDVSVLKEQIHHLAESTDNEILALTENLLKHTANGRQE